jgi:CheY-like chemotaxis protein
VIDPDRESLAALQRALGDVGLTEVTAVPNASFALTMLERDRPDLIVSRAGVPDINGWELCAIVRSDPSMTGVRFLLLAGSADEVLAAAVDGGPDRMLVGELTPATIVDEVVSLLGHTPPPPAAGGGLEPAAGLRGSLAVMDLPDLTQAIALGHKTGSLALALPSGEGVIVFDGGRAVHARFGPLQGEAAFAALVAVAQREGQGSFVFSPLERLAADQSRTIERSVKQLLLSAATEIDEGRAGPAVVPRP